MFASFRPAALRDFSACSAAGVPLPLLLRCCPQFNSTLLLLVPASHLLQLHCLS